MKGWARMPTKHEQIAADLRRKIHEGKLTPGDQLPAETQLMREYRVSPGPVRDALKALRTEGLIETRHGIGSFVRSPRRKVRRSGDRHQWEKDRARLSEDERRETGQVERETGLTVSELAFHAEYGTEQASEDLAKVFGVPAGTKMLHRVYRTRSRAEDSPVSLVDSYLVYDMVAANPDLLTADKEPWPGGTQHQLYTIGIEVDRIIEEIAARPPRAEESEVLGVGPGIAVLFLRKTSIDINGRVVEYSEVVLPGDRTEMVYTTQLQRWST
jgi:GntR family transcriptional regulator